MFVSTYVQLLTLKADEMFTQLFQVCRGSLVLKQKGMIHRSSMIDLPCAFSLRFAVVPSQRMNILGHWNSLLIPLHIFYKHIRIVEQGSSYGVDNLLYGRASGTYDAFAQCDDTVILELHHVAVRLLRHFQLFQCICASTYCLEGSR